MQSMAKYRGKRRADIAELDLTPPAPLSGAKRRKVENTAAMDTTPAAPAASTAAPTS